MAVVAIVWSDCLRIALHPHGGRQDRRRPLRHGHHDRGLLALKSGLYPQADRRVRATGKIGNECDPASGLQRVNSPFSKDFEKGLLMSYSQPAVYCMFETHPWLCFVKNSFRP